MPEEGHSEGTRQIDEDIPVRVADVRPCGLVPKDGPGFRHVSDISGLDPTQPLGQASRCRPWRWYPDIRQLRSERYVS